jgi:hypothetical protein
MCIVSDSTPSIFGIEGPVRSRSRTPIAESGLFAKAWARRPVRVLFPTPPLPLRTCDGVSSRSADREKKMDEDLVLHV